MQGIVESKGCRTNASTANSTFHHTVIIIDVYVPNYRVKMEVVERAY